MSYIEDQKHTQQISAETVQNLRDMLDGPTTQKINKKLSEAEDRILKQIAPIVETMETQESIVNFICRKLGVKKPKGV